MASGRVYELSGGEISVWVDQGSIMLHVHGADTYPVELGEGEAAELSDLLKRLVQEMR